jgi:hypothetical protein
VAGYSYYGICGTFAKNADFAGLTDHGIQLFVDDTDGLAFLFEKMGFSDFIHKFAVN